MAETETPLKLYDPARDELYGISATKTGDIGKEPLAGRGENGVPLATGHDAPGKENVTNGLSLVVKAPGNGVNPRTLKSTTPSTTQSKGNRVSGLPQPSAKDKRRAMYLRKCHELRNSEAVQQEISAVRGDIYARAEQTDSLIKKSTVELKKEHDQTRRELLSESRTQVRVLCSEIRSIKKSVHSAISSAQKDMLNRTVYLPEPAKIIDEDESFASSGTRLTMDTTLASTPSAGTRGSSSQNSHLQVELNRQKMIAKDKEEKLRTYERPYKDPMSEIPFKQSRHPREAKKEAEDVERLMEGRKRAARAREGNPFLCP